MRVRRLMQKIQWIAMAATLALLPTIALAQSPGERIDAAMVRARESGIPVSLLESKKAEGLAKGVPMDRIATAVETRLQQLDKARAAMMRSAKDVDAAQLSVGADAIGAGVSEAALTDIAASAKADRRSVAIAALTYLVSRERLAPDIALSRVKTALANGPQALSDLVNRSGSASGNAPDHPQGNSGGKSGPPVSGPGSGQGRPPVIPHGGPPVGHR